MRVFSVLYSFYRDVQDEDWDSASVVRGDGYVRVLPCAVCIDPLTTGAILVGNDPFSVFDETYVL